MKFDYIVTPDLEIRIRPHCVAVILDAAPTQSIEGETVGVVAIGLESGE
jgi:hypothetical protein